MNNILRFSIILSFLFTATNPLHAQRIQSNGPYGVNTRGIPLNSNRTGGLRKADQTVAQHTITATAETHSTIPTPDPTPPPTQGFSGPITITQGGTYSVRVVSQNQGTAITIATTDPVTITNSVIEGTEKLIIGYDHAKLTVINSDLYGLYPGGTGKHADYAVELYKFDYLHFMHNHIYQKAGISLILWTGSYQGGSPIVVKYNYAYNIDGRLTDGIGGYSGYYPNLAFIQFNTDTNAEGVEIAWNEVENIPNQSATGDNISIFASSGTANSPIDIHDNFIQGAYPFPADTTVFVGGGIMLGDYGGNYLVARNNQVIETTCYGIHIYGGTNETIHDNRIVATKAQQPWSDGMAIYNYYAYLGIPFGNNKSYSNIIGWYRSASAWRDDWYLPDDVLDSNNVHLNGDGTPITLTDVANEYTIWQNKRGGIISPSGEVIVNDTESARFTFTPNPEFHVDSVLVDGVMVDSTEGYTFTNVRSNHTIRVIYAINLPQTDVKNNQNKIPTRFALEQNFPNPFNPTTTITFSVGTYSHTSLRVYDLLGREVATLVNEQKPAGTYTQQWNAANMSSGVYFYRLQVGTFTETKKLIMLK